MESSKNDRLLISSTLATSAICGQVLFNYFHNKSNGEEIQAEAQKDGFTDPSVDEPRGLSREQAFERSRAVHNISYQLGLALPKGGDCFTGSVIITFSLRYMTTDLFLDYKGRRVQTVTINGIEVKSNSNCFRDHKIYIPEQLLQVGENKIAIKFISDFVRDCQGLHYFKDEDDQSEYLYSQFEAADSHKCFPNFDQPDLKASYRLLVVVDQDWIAISNSDVIHNYKIDEEAQFDEQLSQFSLNKNDFLQIFGDNKNHTHLFVFDKSPPISTYLYAVMAGSYQKIDVQQKYKVPMNIYCRKSIAKYVEKMAEDWLYIANQGILYYSDLFGTPYPFGKLDHVFAADYNMGAMENVGCILYTDSYIQREEVFTHTRRQNTYVTLLHEISHMWFGNLVTMKWWDDLWLNESFANFISYTCLDEARGLEDYTLSWNIFLDENFWGMKDDQQETTHPISTLCQNTLEASDLFDGISYGKGASFLKQLYYLYGQDVLRHGLISYFKKYKYQNTQLNDFLSELGQAATELKVGSNLVEWSNSWLTTAGLNIISCEFEHEDDLVKKFYITQKIHKNGKNNRLRVQKFQVGLLDEEMNVYKIVDGQTSDEHEVTEIHALDLDYQIKKPYAYFLNYNCHGYGKFKIDKESLKGFSDRLYMIKESMNRKLLYNILYDMMKDGDISGSQYLDILIKNLINEESEDVLQDNVLFNIPATINNMIPLQYYEERYSQIFELLLEKIIAVKKFKETSTNHLLLDATINCAKSDKEISIVLEWFKKNKLTDLQGKVIEGIEFSQKHKHLMMRRIYSSFDIDLEEKQYLLKQLAEEDKSDWTEKTRSFCNSAHPTIENKKQAWEQYFNVDKEWAYHNLQFSLQGFKQHLHRHLLEQFEEEFFSKIQEIFSSKGRYVAEAFYFGMQPNMNGKEADLNKFKKLLVKAESDATPNQHLIGLIKESIEELERIMKGRELSQIYIDSQN